MHFLFLVGDGKGNKGIRQCLHWLMHMPYGMCGHDSNPSDRMKNPAPAKADTGFLVETEGFEPLTLRMRTVRSPQWQAIIAATVRKRYHIQKKNTKERNK